VRSHRAEPVAHVRILLIDDDAAVLEVVSLMLATDGHDVSTASSGPAGIARLDAGPPVDLVLTDLAMPDMSGWDVVRAVRRRWPDVRVGLVTGTPQYLEEQQEAVDLLVLKPVDLDTLRRAIATLA